MTTLGPGPTSQLLRELERKVLWLSAWTIHHANHLRPNRDGLKVGGHQASCASLGDGDDGALFLGAAARGSRGGEAARRRRCSTPSSICSATRRRDQLERFRALGGAQSYPSRTKDVDDVDFSTGSVGLGVAMTLFASLVQDYVRLKQLAPAERKTGRMVALVGDAELDEGNIFEALLEGWKHDVRNLWWVIDYNRQSLDGVVNDRLFGRIGEMFELVGWRRGHAEIRQAARGGLRPARRRPAAGLDRRLPQLALLGAGLQGRRGLARGAEARSQPVSRHPPHPRAARRRGAASADDQPRRQRHAGRARRLRGHRRRHADLLHRLHHQGPRPAVRRPQGQSLRPDDARPDGGLQEGHGDRRRRGVGQVRGPRGARPPSCRASSTRRRSTRRAAAAPRRRPSPFRPRCRSPATGSRARRRASARS